MVKIFRAFCLLLLLFSQVIAQDTIWVKLNNVSAPYSDIGGSLGLNKIVFNKIISPSQHRLNIVESNYSEHFELVGLSEKSEATNTLFSFSETIFESKYLLLSTNDNSISNIENVADKKIGLIKNSFAEEKLKNALLFYKQFNGSNNAIQSLINNRVEYIVVELAIAKYYLEKENLHNKIYIANENLFSTKIGIKVKSNKKQLLSELNASIRKFRTTNSFAEINAKYYKLQSDNTLLWQIAFVSIIVMLLVFSVYWLRKKNIGNKLLEYHSLTMKGMLIFRVSPTYNSTDADDGSSFKKEINNLQLKYNMLSFLFDYSGNSAKITIKTKRKIYVSDNEFLQNFTDDLQLAVDVLPNEKYMLDINISGEFLNLQKHIAFLIVNKDNRIGLDINESNKSIFPNLI